MFEEIFATANKSGDFDLSQEKSDKIAKEQNLIIETRQPDELQIDRDCPEVDMECLDALKSLLDYIVPTYGHTITRSKGGNIHIRIKLQNPISDLDAVFLQLFCGSDPTREFMSYQRIKLKMDRPILLFEKNPPEVIG